jgi:hypothetical protein
MTDFTITKVRGDGNCLFRTLSYCVWDNDTYYKKIRKQICEFHVKHLSKAIQNGNDYICQMSKDQHWGGGEEILAVAHIYEINIHIYTQTQNGFEFLSGYKSPKANSRDEYILFSNNNHYDYLKLIDKSKKPNNNIIDINITDDVNPFQAFYDEFCLPKELMNNIQLIYTSDPKALNTTLSMKDKTLVVSKIVELAKIIQEKKQYIVSTPEKPNVRFNRIISYDDNSEGYLDRETKTKIIEEITTEPISKSEFAKKETKMLHEFKNFFQDKPKERKLLFKPKPKPKPEPKLEPKKIVSETEKIIRMIEEHKQIYLKYSQEEKDRFIKKFLIQFYNNIDKMYDKYITQIRTNKQKGDRYALDIIDGVKIVYFKNIKEKKERIIRIQKQFNSDIENRDKIFKKFLKEYHNNSDSYFNRYKANNNIANTIFNITYKLF